MVRGLASVDCKTHCKAYFHKSEIKGRISRSRRLLQPVLHRTVLDYILPRVINASKMMGIIIMLQSSMNNDSDLVPPFVAGYETQFWLSDNPAPLKPTPDQITAFGGIAASTEIGLGIRACAFENGMILFDFSNCEKTPVVINRESLAKAVPPDANGLRHIPARVSLQIGQSMKQQSQNQAFYRTIAIAHTLLLENSARIVGGMSMSLPNIEDSSDLVYGYALEKMTAKVPSKFTTPLRPKVVDHSFAALADAVGKGMHVVRSLELHKVSHYRLIKKNFAECLVMSWTLCENMIDFIWKKMIEDIKMVDPQRMGKARVDRLKAQSFTASVRIETLELSGRLNSVQAEGLNFVRKARNSWLHGLHEVTEQEALQSITVCQELITALYGIPIQSTIGGAGGSGGGMYMSVFLARYGADKLKDAYDGS